MVRECSVSTIYSIYGVCCAVRGVVGGFIVWGVVFIICSIYGKCVVVVDVVFDTK